MTTSLPTPEDRAKRLALLDAQIKEAAEALAHLRATRETLDADPETSEQASAS